MTKAILVIDMPRYCGECRYDCGLYGAKPNEHNKRHKGCPLKKMPNKKDDTKTKFMDSTEYARGFNDCIDEILGGGNDD